MTELVTLWLSYSLKKLISIQRNCKYNFTIIGMIIVRSNVRIVFKLPKMFKILIYNKKFNFLSMLNDITVMTFNAIYKIVISYFFKIISAVISIFII